MTPCRIGTASMAVWLRRAVGPRIDRVELLPEPHYGMPFADGDAHRPPLHVAPCPLVDDHIAMVCAGLPRTQCVFGTGSSGGAVGDLVALCRIGTLGDLGRFEPHALCLGMVRCVTAGAPGTGVGPAVHAALRRALSGFEIAYMQLGHPRQSARDRDGWKAIVRTIPIDQGCQLGGRRVGLGEGRCAHHRKQDADEGRTLHAVAPRGGGDFTVTDRLALALRG